MTGEWRYLRRRSTPALIRHLAKRHPELVRPCVWDDFVRIAEREEIVVRVVELPPWQQARMVRFGQRPFIQLSKRLTRDERTVVGFHELAHFWRDDPGVACYHAEQDDRCHPREDFADIFAWAVTSPARQHVPGIREEDF